MPGRFSRFSSDLARPWSIQMGRAIKEFLDKLSDGMSTLQGTPDTPVDVAPDNVADAGVGPAPALEDHVHALPAGTVVGLDNATSDGTSNDVARGNHVHKRDTRVKAAGSDVGTRNALNFVDGTTVDFTVTDNGGADSVDVTAEISASALAGSPRWTKYTKTHTQLQAAAMANDIELFSLPAGGVIHAVKIKHSVLFAGTGITDYKLSVGIAGTLNKYAAAFDVDTAVSATNFQLSSTVGSENHTAATSIRLAATSAGANLDQSTGGSVDVWILSSVAT